MGFGTAFLAFNLTSTNISVNNSEEQRKKVSLITSENTRREIKREVTHSDYEKKKKKHKYLLPKSLGQMKSKSTTYWSSYWNSLLV